MTVYESDLPGVGKKHEVELDGEARLVVVTHNTGKREVFRRANADADAEKLFELPDDLARTVGTVLEGAYFQPVASEDIDTVLGGDALIQWYEVPAGSELAGETIETADVRRRTGASIIAVQQRDGDVMPNPDPGEGVRGGDTVVVIGSRAEVDAFEEAFIGDGGSGGGGSTGGGSGTDAGGDTDRDGGAGASDGG